MYLDTYIYIYIRGCVVYVYVLVQKLRLVICICHNQIPTSPFPLIKHNKSSFEMDFID